MAFHPNQHTQGNNMIFPDRRQSQGINQGMSQSLNPVNNFAPLNSLGSYTSRQFDPTNFDSRGYLNPSDPWKNGNPIFPPDQGDASSPNLQNSLLSGNHAGISSIQSISPPTSGYPNQTLRMMQSNDAQLPYFNQSPLVPTSQQQYSSYQHVPASNGQSQAMSVAHMAPQSPTASFIRRYSGSTNMMGGIDPSSLTNGMGYSNPGYPGQLGGMDSFGRNSLSQYVDNEGVMSNPALKSKPENMAELQYGNGNNNVGNQNSTDFNVMNNNGMSHDTHLQSESSIEDNYSQVHNSSMNSGLNQGFPQFQGGTIAPAQVSNSPTRISKTKSIIPKDAPKTSPKALANSNNEGYGEMKSNGSHMTIKPKSPKTPKSKPKQSLSLPQNTSSTGQKLKRPMNAFLIYASERRPQLQQSDPTMTTAAQSKILGDEWAKMDDSHKQAFVERARALKSEFLETNPDYVYTRRPNNTKKKYRRRSVIDGDNGSPKLKRPMNAYLLFNKEMRHKLLETNPNMSVSEISKEIGDRWKNLNEEERNRYFTEAQSIKRDFLVTNPDFVYTRRSKAEIEAGKKRGLDEEDDFTPTRDPRGRKKKKQKNPTAPKHPMSGFLFYLSAVRPQVAEQYPGSTVGPISKIIASQWNSMVPEDRAPWEQKATEDKARYAREMEVYLADKQ